jgi:hypothetical protein
MGISEPMVSIVFPYAVVVDIMKPPATISVFGFIRLLIWILIVPGFVG